MCCKRVSDSRAGADKRSYDVDNTEYSCFLVSFVRWLVGLFVLWLVLWYVCLQVCWFIYLLVCVYVPLLVCWLVWSFSILIVG